MTHEHGAKAVFPLNAFTTETVSRLTHLSVRQLHHWDRTGFFSPAFVDPNTRRPHSRVYSFQDVVGLRTIAKLREAGVSLKELRKVRTLFAPDMDNEWAQRKFYVVGRRVFFSHKDAIVATRPLGQYVEPDILEIGPIVSNITESILQLNIRTEEKYGEIARNRSIMSGVPVIAGTRIPTSTITWFHRNGYSVKEILVEFPRLTEADIKAAIAFEKNQEERVQHDLLAAS